MSNPSKAKGSAWELAVARYLGLERQYGAGRKDDVGDIANDPLFAVECKALKQFDLATAVTEAEREAENAGKLFGVAVIKKPRAGVQDGYLVIRLETWKRLRSRIS